jgi:hypothetical protein
MFNFVNQINLIFSDLDQLACILEAKPYIHKNKKGPQRDACFFTWLVHESLLEILVLHAGPLSSANRQLLDLRSRRLNKSNCTYFRFHETYNFSVEGNPIPSRIHKPHAAPNNSFSCLHHKTPDSTTNPKKDHSLQHSRLSSKQNL